MDKNRPGIDWSGGTMIIQVTTAIFEGEYQCFASNQHGTSMSAFTELEMNVLADYPERTVLNYQVTNGDRLMVGNFSKIKIKNI